MFVEKYSVSKMIPADYNPRKITEGSFDKLKESLRKFGVIKPVVVNKNGVLIAGHQRTKAMKSVGIKEAPAFVFDKKIHVADEIRFNLMHNSVETENSLVIIENHKELKYGFNEVEHREISIKNKRKGIGPSLKEISELLIKYGNFCGIIIDDDGVVIHNADYACACKINKIDLICYKLTSEQAKEFMEYMKIDYGKYYYETLNIKPYVQTHCQMSRSEDTHKSTTYLNIVIPNITPKQRGLDFGAGKCFYANHLKSKGYNIKAYEPFFKKLGTEKLSITSVVKMIEKVEQDVKENGLFDYVVLDSVLNSVSSNFYEDKILKTCNALLKDDGVFYTGTRNIKEIECNKKLKQSVKIGRTIEFLDDDNYSATYRKGVWTLQKFNSKESLHKLLSKYFKEVTVFDKSVTQLWAICKYPIRFTEEEYDEALEAEFNIEYPNGYRHNKHHQIKKQS